MRRAGPLSPLLFCGVMMTFDLIIPQLKTLYIMKLLIFAVFLFVLTALIQPVTSVSFAQNCVCAECNYPCKSPMVHASNCKYNNGRQEENVTETTEQKSVEKSIEVEKVDTEYRMLLIHSAVRNLAADNTADNVLKEKKFTELKSQLEQLVPENDVQKMMYERIKEDLEAALKQVQKSGQ